MHMVFMTFRSSLEDEVLKRLEAERASFTFVEKARRGMLLAQFTGAVATRCCLREFKMSSSVASGNAFIIWNGSSMEKARCKFPFMSSSCLASNGSNVSGRAEYPCGTRQKTESRLCV